MTHPHEATGAAYDPQAQRDAQALSWQALHAIAARIRPGMRESEATALAQTVLAETGASLDWHPVMVRFGANTLKTFREKSDGDPVLGASDIYFLDLGPVFLGHEGDVGASFAVGDDPVHHEAVAAVKTLFDHVATQWARDDIAGAALYQAAAREAEAMGWVLNLDIRGHRVGDYPHRVHHTGTLGDHPVPAVGDLWILEIQLRHPTRPFGAFYEDLLSRPA